MPLVYLTEEEILYIEDRLQMSLSEEQSSIENSTYIGPTYYEGCYQTLGTNKDKCRELILRMKENLDE